MFPTKNNIAFVLKIVSLRRISNHIRHIIDVMSRFFSDDREKINIVERLHLGLIVATFHHPESNDASVCQFCLAIKISSVNCIAISFFTHIL